jgi:hypothetical protein
MFMSIYVCYVQIIKTVSMVTLLCDSRPYGLQYWP